MASTGVIEVLPIETEYFYAIPPAPRHAISTHLPGWDLIVEFAKRDPVFWVQFHDMYPRFLIHRDIKQVRIPINIEYRMASMLTFLPI